MRKLLVLILSSIFVVGCSSNTAYNGKVIGISEGAIETSVLLTLTTQGESITRRVSSICSYEKPKMGAHVSVEIYKPILGCSILRFTEIKTEDL